MAGEYTIPMQQAPQGAAAGLDTRTPMGGDYKLPLDVKQPPPVDLFEDTMKAYKMADTQEQFKADQTERLDKIKTTEEKQNDQSILKAYTAAGHQLVTSDDWSLAIKELGGKVSPSTLQNMTDNRDKAAENSQRVQDLFSKVPRQTLQAHYDYSTLLRTQLDEITSPAAAELKAHPDQQQQIMQDFKSKLQVVLQSAAALKDPTTRQPVYPPQMLAQLEKADVAGVQAAIGNMDNSRVGMQKTLLTPEQESTMALHGAEITKDIAQAGEADAKAKEAAARAKLAADGGKPPPNMQWVRDSEGRPTGELTFVPGGKADPAVMERDAEARRPKADEKKVDDAVKAIMELHRPPPPITARNGTNPEASAIWDKLENAGYDINDWTKKQLAQKQFIDGPDGKRIQSTGVAVQHMQVLEDLSKAIKDRDTQTQKYLMNRLSVETGGTPVVSFNAAKELVADEIANAVVGGGTGASALTDRENQKKIIADKLMQGQVSTVLKDYRLLLGGQVNILRDKYVRNKLGTADDFNRNADEQGFLNEDTRKALGLKDPEKKTTASANPKAAGKDNDPSSILNDEMADQRAALKEAKTPEDKSRIEKSIAALQKEMKTRGVTEKVPEKDTSPPPPLAERVPGKTMWMGHVWTVTKDGKSGWSDATN